MPTSSARVLAGPICQPNTMESGVSGDGMKNSDCVRGAGAAIAYSSNTTKGNRDLGGKLLVVSWRLGLN